jgi:hypothetical protein
MWRPILVELSEPSAVTSSKGVTNGEAVNELRCHPDRGEESSEDDRSSQEDPSFAQDDAAK